MSVLREIDDDDDDLMMLRFLDSNYFLLLLLLHLVLHDDELIMNYDTLLEIQKIIATNYGL